MKTNIAPLLVPKTRKQPRKRRSLAGVRERGNRRTAYVKVGKGKDAINRTKDFPKGTPDWEIVRWREETLDELKALKPVKGTLSALIDRHLAGMPDGRPKIDARANLNPWKTAIGTKPIGSISVTVVSKCFSDWQADGYAGSTLNHRRQALLTLWEAQKLSGSCPASKIGKFEESAPRKGFFEHDQYEKVLRQLPDHYRDVVIFAQYSGWRRQEIQRLVWSEVDLAGGVIRLSPERSKNDEGRVLPIDGPLVEMFERRSQARLTAGVTHREGKQTVTRDYVFYRTVGGKKAGHKAKPVRHLPIGDWRKSWAKACVAAGCPGALLHDFRRTVVRNLTRSGVHEKIAMSWTGHKTREVFDRYNIVNEADLRDAAKRVLKGRESR